MKLHEAISKVDGSLELWFRPVAWKGRGEAYALDREQRTHLVPTPRGGNLHMTHNANILAGDWEVVTPDEVLSETA